MFKILVTAFYVVVASSGLVLLKLGAVGTPVKWLAGRISFDISPYALAGVIMYGLSFLVYIYLLSKNDLGFIIPLTTGLVYILIMAASYFIFHETFSAQKIIGIFLVFLGILFLTWTNH